ncbi:MAG: pyruvate, phosphate dikinase [Candidatus Schekmanbacteria bacterium]|nr:pyruvate, phosphate dikinase [Candidatus Schekmanbacteria bacterium]
MADKFVYCFGRGSAEGNADMKNLLGGKGANLAEMTNLGVPVPAGFTISTEVCKLYYDNNRQYPGHLWDEVLENLKKVETAMGHKFGDQNNPLLVSVRSGARISMPGMMDTVLNLGLNDDTIQGVIKQSGNERFAYDSYRRFVQMYGDVVLGVGHDKFEKLLEAKKESRQAKSDTDLDARALKELVKEYKQLVAKETGSQFPDDPFEQLRKAIGAVFESWDTERAVTYRKIHNIPGHWGTAVNVQSMVFGNLGNDSGTGVAFTRDPSNGNKIFFGEYLLNAQGEDVVAGTRTPQPINKAQKKDNGGVSLEESMPEVYNELVGVYQNLEKHYKEMQDIEFTIQQGTLYLLQTRTGKRTAASAVKIAVDMVKEGLIDKKTAIMRVSPAQLDQLLHPTIDPKASVKAVAKGLPASPGAAVGRVVFSAEHAVLEAEMGHAVILVRNETSPEDIAGMYAAKGILTARGGMTSHAAVVARGMGKCCVAGCGAIRVSEEEKIFTVGDQVVKEGDFITLNGTTGQVILGKVALVQPELSGDFGILMEWVDEFKTLKVRTNADLPADAAIARKFGAEGIGLCRTEHMFFGEERLPIVQQMILADNKEARLEALAKLLPFQRGDFYGIFKAMAGLPVTIRHLDPPLHEFLPNREELIEKITEIKVTLKYISDEKEINRLKSQLHEHENLLHKVQSLHEFNPMLGHRGCRLGITYPEIYDMQTQAIIEAACQLAQEGQVVEPEIMIPLVGTVEELKTTKAAAIKVAESVMAKQGIKIKYSIGTMIEVPRAALTADAIAKEAEFFSFGTNDLTQMTFGFSRDDAGVFLPGYVEKGLLPEDPFVALDQVGVGLLVQMAVAKGRAVNPALKIGICGEHGGEPSSVEFCHRSGLNYVSCSPYRVPIARLAAAQARIKEKASVKQELD